MNFTDTPEEFRKRFDAQAYALDCAIERQRDADRKAAWNEAEAIVSQFIGDIQTKMRGIL